MERQLILLSTGPGGDGCAAPAGRSAGAADWRLDEETRRRGREGVALARAALARTSRAVAA